jgi:hypothetical protein
MSAVVIGALGAQIRAIGSRGGRFTASGTFVPSVTGWHIVRLQAAGGAGGGAAGGGGAIGYWGGCAGEFIEVKQYLIAGTGYSYTVPGVTAGANAAGANGGNAVFVGPHSTITARGGGGGQNGSVVSTQHRRDGLTTSGAPALFAAPGSLWGANGGGTSTAGGYAGMNPGGTASTGGGGGSSLYGVGGTGAVAWGLPGGAGGLGAGGGGATTNGGAAAGGAGGAGVVEIEYIGAA